jgi:hypothetical protein
VPVLTFSARSGHSPTRLRITAFDPSRKFGSEFSMTGPDPKPPLKELALDFSI